MKALALILALLLPGCASFKEPGLYTGIVGDGVTTYIAVTNPDRFTELNPLGLATIPLAILVAERAEKLPREQGLPILHGLRSVKWAGFVNNLLVFAGAAPAVSIGAGAIVGWRLWHAGADERAYALFCADWIAQRHGNTCKPWRAP